MARTPKTSADHPLLVGWLIPQKLGLTFAPGKFDPNAGSASWARDLPTDVTRLATEYGTKTLVSLIEDHELELLQISKLADTCEVAGIEVIRFPIKDGQVPHDLDAVKHLVRAIVARVQADGTVVIHCRGGLGRAGTIGGCALIGLGKTANEVFPLLLEARGIDCPENDGQRAYIRRFEEIVREQPLGV